MVSVQIRLGLLAALVGGLLGPTLPAMAQEGLEEVERESVEMAGALNTSTAVSVAPSSSLLLSEIEQPATTLTDWIAQIEASLVQITGVRVEETETGVQIVLETAEGSLEVSETRSLGNALIVDISNATLADEVYQANPSEGIALVSVTPLPDGRVRVAITGTDAPPVAEVRSDVQGLVLTINPGDAVAEGQEDAIQLVVTGEQDTGYYTPEASVGTRTDTPLRNIPQSIQVIPQQVLEDQQVTNLNEALRNAPGVSTGPNPSTRGFFALPRIRGFNAENDILTNGLRDTNNAAFGFSSATVERIEVLRGPASVLYGQGSLGGIINLITRQPLSDPYYSVEASIGSFDLYRGVLDVSGPLNEDETVLYRLIGSAQTSESFVDFFDRQEYRIAPSLAWLISDRTRLTVAAEYVNRPQNNGQDGLPAVGTVLSNPLGELSRSRSFSELYSQNDLEAFRIGYDVEHELSENWQLRNAFRVTWLERQQEDWVQPIGLGTDNRTLTRFFADGERNFRDLNFDLYVTGEFSTGTIEHELVAGVNYFRRDIDERYSDSGIGPSIDIFDPEYEQPFDRPGNPYEEEFGAHSYGIYVQDLISLTDNLKLLLGGRFDITDQNSEDILNDISVYQQQEAFSPRVGIVYQPIPAISLYGSYSRSFLPPLFQTFEEVAEPERGTQYEVGVKADLGDRIAATLALYDLTRSNVSTADPNNPLRSIQVGEQQSRGIELNVTGEILPGWNIIAGYALTDTEILKDNTFEVGNQLPNIPRHSASLWSTYEIQSGDLQGLGFGLGLFFVGERQGDLANTFDLPSYLRTDAAIFYERDQFRVALNFKNLFDIEYFESALNRANVYAGEPFTVIGTVAWEF